MATAQKESLARVKAASAPPEIGQNDPYNIAASRQKSSSTTSASGPSIEKATTVKLENPYELASVCIQILSLANSYLSLFLVISSNLIDSLVETCTRVELIEPVD